ncbi:MAG: sensor histidine kinase YesM [Polaribacter sp.]|jgi:sensor histidine kinase YesM
MLQIKPFLKRTNALNIAVFSAILWSFSFLILLFLFSGSSSPSKIDYIYTASFIFTLVVPVCINLYWLLPTYLKKEKYVIFTTLFIVNLTLFAQINPWFFNVLVDTFFKDYFFISYHNTVEIYFIFAVFFILSALIKLAEDWVYLNQLENRALKIQNQQIENQLHYLKGQINPHFLFNSLNVLYSLAIEEKKEVKNAILQLSDILRYVIYDVNAAQITIMKEIELLTNYIEFEKNRHVQNSTITFDYKVDEDLEIYPMLLLPLLENSFKHGLKSGTLNPYINMELIVKNKKIDFVISNNFKESTNNTTKEEYGIGLKNIQENLALIYPDKHLFSIENSHPIFTVRLTIDLEK